MTLKSITQKIAILFAILSMTSLSVWAHGVPRPHHGGVIAMDGEALIEIVVQKNKVDLYVIYDDEDIESANCKANLIINLGNSKREVALTPAGENKFEAKGLSIAKNSKVIVFVQNIKTKDAYNTDFIIE